MSEFDPTDIRGQERAQAEQARVRKVSKDTEESDLKWLMGRRQGRRIVWRLLEKSGVFQSVFNTNAMAMSFAEGKRNYGLEMLTMIHVVCPEQYQTMLKERHDHRDPDDGSAAST